MLKIRPQFRLIRRLSQQTKDLVPQDKDKEFKKKDLEWRKPWHKQDIGNYDLLRTFYSESNNVTVMKWLQQPIDFSPASIKRWYARQKVELEIQSQLYMPERNATLGPELACAHFIVSRGGAVKFHGDDKWIKMENDRYELPDQYKSGMYLQGIDCTELPLRYEGLSNMRRLRNVEWLSLNGCDYIDDFCMDVITNIFSDSLIYLDLRNCVGITEKGLGAIYKLPKLRLLYLDDLLKDTRYEMTCLLLEETNPELNIKSDVVTFEIK